MIHVFHPMGLGKTGVCVCVCVCVCECVFEMSPHVVIIQCNPVQRDGPHVLNGR